MKNSPVTNNHIITFFRFFSIAVLLAFSLCTARAQVAIKGLSIDMPIEDALVLANSKLASALV